MRPANAWPGRWARQGSVVGVLVALVFGGTGAYRAIASHAAAPSPSPRPTSCVYPDPPPGFPAEKLPAWRDMQFCNRSVWAGPGPKPGIVPPPALQAGLTPPEHRRVIGTPAELGGQPIPFSPATTTITNMYLDLVNGDTTMLSVYAGVQLAQPGQGVLIVATSSPAVPTSTLDVYPLPKAGGPARLTGLTGQLVSVVDAAGDAFVFDVTQRSWR